jgi:hypothetical protein
LLVQLAADPGSHDVKYPGLNGAAKEKSAASIPVKPGRVAERFAE